MAERSGFLGRMFGGKPKTDKLDDTTPPAAETPPAPKAAPEAPPQTPPETARPSEPTGKRSWLQRLTGGLARSSGALADSITGIFTKRKLDDDMLEELEDALIRADLGIDTATAVTDALRRDRFDKTISPEEVRAVMAAEIEKVLTPIAKPLEIDDALKPHVVLVVGVNGTGKTTTIGKLASKYRSEGRSVMLAAGDTFRAAAVEQLRIWADRTGAGFVSRDQGADAAGLAFDALTEARDKGVDVLLFDTAGRLQNKDALMAELEKVIRVIRKVDPTAPHTVLMTLDATTGQNAMNQVEVFGRRAGITGLVMTKLDGTARGGILVAVAGKYGIPVHYIGVGEQVDDLEPFSAADFAAALAGSSATDAEQARREDTP